MVLAGVKALQKYGVKLNLIRDQLPDGVVEM